MSTTTTDSQRGRFRNCDSVRLLRCPPLCRQWSIVVVTIVELTGPAIAQEEKPEADPDWPSRATGLSSCSPTRVERTRAGGSHSNAPCDPSCVYTFPACPYCACDNDRVPFRRDDDAT